MEKLADHNIIPFIAITVTKPFLNWIQRDLLTLLMWIDKYRLGGISFIRLIKTGRAEARWGDLGVTNSEYSQFLIETFNIQSAIMRNVHSEFKGFYPISEYVDAFNNRGGLSDVCSCLNGWCDSNSFSIDENGIRLGCLTMPESVGSGDVYAVTVDDMTVARKKRMTSCINCKFRDCCNTGCLSSNRVDESGACSGGYSVFEYIESRLSN